MNRETKELVTTSGKKVAIKSYLTGREVNEIKAATYAGVGITSPTEEGERSKVDKIPVTAEITREEKILDMSVVSFEGSTDKPAEQVKDLPSDEYADIFKQISTALKLNFQKAK